MRQLTSQPLEYPSRPGSKGCEQRGAGFAAYRIRNEGNIDRKDLTYCRNIFNIHSISSISGVVLWPHLLHCGYPLKAQQVVKNGYTWNIGLGLLHTFVSARFDISYVENKDCHPTAGYQC